MNLMLEMMLTKSQAPVCLSAGHHTWSQVRTGAEAEELENPELRQRRRKLKGLLQKRQTRLTGVFSRLSFRFHFPTRSEKALAELERRRQKADRRKQLQQEAGSLRKDDDCS